MKAKVKVTAENTRAEVDESTLRELEAAVTKRLEGVTAEEIARYNEGEQVESVCGAINAAEKEVFASWSRRPESVHIQIGGAYGTVEHEGRMLTLTQEPYLGGGSNEGYYVALAIDPGGNEYEVTWAVIETESDDESDRADWDKYDVRPLSAAR